MSGISHAVFLSYASQDAEAAQKICEALRAAGIEVWFDQSELRSGEAWDRSIRKQIRDCRLFIAVISTHSETRDEGYFRREWKLAVDRTHDMDERKAFLVPVVIDATSERGAHVPEKFHELQWTRLPHGETPPAFIERVRRLLSPENASAPEPARSAIDTARSAPAPRGLIHRRTGPLYGAIAAAVLLALAYVGFERLRGSKSSAPGTASSGALPSPATTIPAPMPEKSIAVLPFVDLSEKHDQEYFGDGMAEEIINLLVKVPELKVIGRTSSFQFKAKTDDLRKIGNTLGTAYVVEGSVRRSGGHIRVIAQLIDARDGTHRWSETYDRAAGDALQVQDEIAASLVRALQLEVTGLSRLQGRALPRDSEVYDSYLRGLHAVNQYDRSGYEEAVADFRRALELDPSFVPAAEGLAYALAVQTDFGYAPLAKGWAEARAASQKTLDLDPRSALAHTVLGILHTRYDWNWPVAESELETAVTLAPNNPIGLLNLANERMAVGQWTEAMRLADAAIAIDPLDPQGHLTRAWAYMQLNRLAEAEHSFRRVVELAPTFAFGHYFLGLGLLIQGKSEEALAEMLKETDVDGRNAGLAMAYHALHRKQQADTALKDLETPSTGDIPWYFAVARAYAFRGQKDEAFKWLEKAYARKGGDLWLIKGDPFWKTLSDDPRYKALLHKMNLPE